MTAAVTAPLLVELRTEELPPKALQRLSEAFTAALVKGLRDHHLIGDAATDAGGSAVQAFATPRRLAVLVPAVAAAAPDR